MRARWLPVALATALLVAACGGDTDDTDPQADAPAQAPTSQADNAVDAAGEDSEPPVDAPTEQAVSPDSEDEASDAPEPTSAPAAGPTISRFETPDGETLEAAVFGDGDVGIVLAHMRGRDKTTWYGFAESAAQSGYRVLAFDFRGYGGSTGEQDTDLDVDLIAAVEFLRSQGVSSTVVMGASMGATATVNVASRLDLAGAVSLSAPGNFIGLEATGVASGIAEPLLLVAAENDQPYADAAVEIDSLASSAQLQIFAGNAHGTNLFAEYDGELTQLLLDFVAAVVG